MRMKAKAAPIRSARGSAERIVVHDPVPPGGALS